MPTKAIIPYSRMKIKLILALANPGAAYKNTYHSVGAMFLEYLLQKSMEFGVSQVAGPKKTAGGKYFKWDGLALAVSDNYMNESGRSALAFIKFLKIQPAEMLVLHDDSDLAIGKYNLAFGRGAAGHHGVESIISSLNTKNFWRLRIGIRDTNLDKNARKKAGEFVLKKISAAHKEKLYSVFADGVAEIRKLTEKDMF